MRTLPWTLLLIAAMAGIAALYPITKSLGGSVSPLLVAFFRFSIAAIVLLPVMFYMRRHLVPKSRDLPLLLFVSACIATPTALIVIGIAHTNSVVAAILINTNPLMIGLFSPVLISEEVHGTSKLALAVGFLGVMLVVLNGHSPITLLNSYYAWGALLLLLAALASALNKIYSKRLVRAYDGLSVTFFSTIIGAVLLGIGISLTGGFSDVLRFNLREIISLIAIGIVCTAIPWVVWSSSLKRLDVHVAASFQLLIPIFAAFYSLLFLSESFTLWMMLGLILTSAGIYVVQRRETIVANM